MSSQLQIIDMAPEHDSTTSQQQQAQWLTLLTLLTRNQLLQPDPQVVPLGFRSCASPCRLLLPQPAQQCCLLHLQQWHPALSSHTDAAAQQIHHNTRAQVGSPPLVRTHMSCMHAAMQPWLRTSSSNFDQSHVTVMPAVLSSYYPARIVTAAMR